MTDLRIGHGYDVHRLSEGRKLILGGVEIPYEKGLLGHSDADVLVHAVMDALAGAARLGDIGKLFRQVQPEDLLKFGIIPELVGRLPVIAPLNALQREDLVRILQEPKNALVKQYKKLLEYDDVDLEFTEDALNAIADKAIERNIGARGLRAVMEGLLTKVMYEIPSDETVVKAVVTKECVEGTAEPELTHDPNKINYSVKLNPGRSESRSESGTSKSAS